MCIMSQEIIAALSRDLGSRKGYVLAGGGNSSWKDEKYLYIKPSGVALAVMEADDLVKMDRALLADCMTAGAAADPADRESVVKRYTDFSVLASKNGRRPSVEAPLHTLFPQKFVMHLHPTLVSALVCGNDGEAICKELFPEALWMGVVDPGATLAIEAKKAFTAWADAHNGEIPALVFLQNHGVFVASDDPEKIGPMYEDIFAKITAYCESKGVKAEDATAEASDMDFVRENAPVLRGLLAADGVPAAVCAMEQLELPCGPFSPDHIVYSKSFALVTDEITKEAVEAFKAEHGYLPMAIKVPGKALFAAGKDVKAMRTAAAFIQDSATILKLTAAFGGAHVLPDAARKFIETWEMEAYRSKVASGSSAGALSGKIALVTGGAQGFGYGISEELIKQGAHVIVADLNAEGAAAAATRLGVNASSLAVDVSNEDSVAALADAVIYNFGGLDLFVNNAGIAKAGSLEEMQKGTLEFVTAVNYTGYFLCAKYASRVMKLQHSVAPDYMMDIVENNSKSGLEGSNKNFAYSGSKFGGIGLTASFAMELAPYNIKVNAVCPGNYLDGPLWSDPEKGLFVQYLNAGKVPGAKTVEDVRKFYMSKVPLNRGCLPVDVARAIMYCVEQKYETGQAIPVTGGQVMLH